MKSPVPSQSGFVRGDVGQTFLPVHGFSCAKLFTFTFSFNSHTVPRDSEYGIVPILPTRKQKLREINKPPQVPQLEAGKAGFPTRTVCLRTHPKYGTSTTPFPHDLHLPFTSPG